MDVTLRHFHRAVSHDPHEGEHEFGLTPSAVGRINLPQGSERSLEEIVNARKYFGES